MLARLLIRDLILFPSNRDIPAIHESLSEILKELYSVNPTTSFSSNGLWGESTT